jgi:hypothetical protein
MMAEPTSISAMEGEVEEESGPSNPGAIYVDVSVPAVLRCSETVVAYPTLQEARTAWLALPLNVKKDASITTDERGGACYHSWEIYQLWAR